jgi:nitrate reductase molybdenum cofactor assembly chaperone NarJ/NarW
MLYRLLSRLLDYPTAELQTELPNFWPMLETLPAADRKIFTLFLGELQWDNLLEWQALYVKTFDQSPENTLYLTYHLFGDDKNRGPALIDLSEFYQSYGLTLEVNELPDYLPLMLEFSSQLSPEEARMFWMQWHKVLVQLATHLEQIESLYAPLIRLIEQHSQWVKAA